MEQYRYSLRFNLEPTTDLEQRVEALVDFCRRAAIGDVMFFIGAEDFNTGHITIEQARPYVNAIARAGERLRGIGVTVSLNPWVTLLHGDRGRTLQPGQDFALMTDCNGRTASAVVCPLSEKWRAYYLKLMRFYARALRPRVLWFEDDFRLFNHEPLADGGCFCEAHMRLYREETGCDTLTREAFVAGLLENREGYRAAYRRVNRAVMRDVLRELVEGLGGYQDKFGLMTSGASVYMLEGRDQRETFDVLSARAGAVNRLSMGCYRQMSSLAYAWDFNAGVMLGRAMVRDELEVVSEIENFPMTRYSKSARFTGFQMEMSLPLCLCGQTLDIFEFNGNGILDGAAFARELAARKPLFDRFSALGVRFSELTGVEVLVNAEAPLTKRGDGKDLTSLIPRDTYWAGWLGCVGIGFRYTENAASAGRVVAVSGEVLRCFRRETVEGLFRNNFVLLTANSAEVLLERGMGELAGIRSLTRLTERQGLYTYEQAVLAPAEIPQQRSSCQYFCGDYCRVEYTGEVRRLTDVYNYDQTLVGPGIAVYGDRVLLLPYYERDYPFGLYTPLRENAVANTLAGWPGGQNIVHALQPNAVPYRFRCEERDVVVVDNFGDDEEGEILLECGENYREIDVITRQGVTKRAPFFREGRRYAIATPLLAMSAHVLLCRRGE